MSRLMCQLLARVARLHPTSDMYNPKLSWLFGCCQLANSPVTLLTPPEQKAAYLLIKLFVMKVHRYKIVYMISYLLFSNPIHIGCPFLFIVGLKYA